MKNREKFQNELIDFALRGISVGIKHGKPIPCKDLPCEECDLYKKSCSDLTEWAEQEYIEKPTIDWSKIQIDTPILVRDFETQDWMPRYFAKYEDDKVFAWHGGKTSVTAIVNTNMCSWKYAKLAPITNKEMYKDKITEIASYGNTLCVVNGEPKACEGTVCSDCDFSCELEKCSDKIKEWCEQEYIEVDWTKVPIDTPVFVRDNADEAWCKRHFYKYVDGRIRTFDHGRTSFTSNPFDESNIYEETTGWLCGRLAEKQEVDWAKIPVDTPILVSHDGKTWIKMHFAKYEHGSVYAFLNGDTSCTTDGFMGVWEYVRLA